MNCNTTHYRANSSSVPGDPTEWIRTAIGPEVLRWGLGISFLLIALWALKPDTVDEQAAQRSRLSIFGITFIAFFLAEMGDKTQIATVALAVKYTNLFGVVLGTTLGMMIANVPAVLLGKFASPAFPFKLVRLISAGIFAVLGIAVLFGLG